MAPSSNDQTSAPHAPLGRRRFLAIGGASVATAAVIAACAGTDGGIGRVGVAPTAAPLPEAPVNDIVLLRTASSLEHTIIDVIDRFLGDPDLLDAAAYGELFRRMRSDHQASAKRFESLTTEAGGVAWTQANPRMSDVVLPPIMDRITGKAATATTTEIPPSDDPRRDALSVAHGLESVAAATYQGYMTSLSTPDLRGEVIGAAITSSRHAAALAIGITGRPDGYVNPTDVQNATLESTTTTAPPTTAAQDIASQATTEQDGSVATEAAVTATAVPPVYAMPATFGRLAAVQIAIGAPSEAGTRTTINLDTPSLNSFVYEYMEPTGG